MKKTILSLGLLLSTTSQAATLAGAPGVWIEKNEAVELRTTGKIQSLCEEVNKDPHSTIMNVRSIDAKGGTYIYNPTIGKIPQLLMGKLAVNGVLATTPAFQQQLGDASMSASVSGNTLTFTYKGKDLSIGMDYLRSSDKEARQYYKAQKACKAK